MELKNKKIAYDAQERSPEDGEDQEGGVVASSESQAAAGSQGEPAGLSIGQVGRSQRTGADQVHGQAENLGGAAELPILAPGGRQFLESTVPPEMASGIMPLEMRCQQDQQQEPVDLTQEEDMHKTPGRKSRKPEETAEELEYNQRGTSSTAEKDQWSMVSTPPEM